MGPGRLWSRLSGRSTGSSVLVAGITNSTRSNISVWGSAGRSDSKADTVQFEHFRLRCWVASARPQAGSGPIASPALGAGGFLRHRRGNDGANAEANILNQGSGHVLPQTSEQGRLL